MLNNTLVRFGSPDSRRFCRFLVVGALNSVVGYGLYAIFVLLKFSPELALLIATILGVIFNFVSTGHFVFGDRNRSRIMRFVAVYIAVYLFNAVALRGLTSLLVHPLFAQLFLLPVTAVMTFIALRSFVFKETDL